MLTKKASAIIKIKLSSIFISPSFIVIWGTGSPPPLLQALGVPRRCWGYVVKDVGID